MTNQTTPKLTEDQIVQVQFLARTYGDQIVRRDNKFFDLEHLGVALSRNDVEMMLINRIREEHPEIQVTPDLLRELFRLLVEKKHTDTERSFQVWNGSAICVPGDDTRLIKTRGAVSVNLWSEPEYRKLRVNSSEATVIEEFFSAFFQRVEDRDQFLDWLAWCVMNEAEKPAWAPFLYSRSKGTGKSTACRIVSELFGHSNTAVQNNISKLTQKFNSTVLTSKLVVSEETQVRPGSTQANAIKTYITDPYVLVERKGMEAERVRQCCCFLFTSNFAPTWMEEGERRYFVIDVNHGGCSGGAKLQSSPNW